MLYPILLLILAVLIWLGLYFTGNDTHTADGIVLFGLVGLEGLLIWFQGRKPSVWRRPPVS